MRTSIEPESSGRKTDLVILSTLGKEEVGIEGMEGRFILSVSSMLDR